MLKNRVDPQVKEAVVELAFEQPAYGQVRVSNELRKRNLFISPGGVRSVWLRHDLETFKKRLKTLEPKVAQEGIILTESQLAALERAKQEKEGFYQVAFRKKIDKTIEELQADPDLWIKQCKEQRPHGGKYCFGKTPMQTFLDSIPLAKDKMLDSTFQSVA